MGAHSKTKDAARADVHQTVTTKIVKMLDALALETQRLESVYLRKLTALAELNQSLLHWAFTGKL